MTRPLAHGGMRHLETANEVDALREVALRSRETLSTILLDQRPQESPFRDTIILRIREIDAVLNRGGTGR